MQSVCEVLEQMVADGVVTSYAIGGATAAGFHGEPLATRDIDVFVSLDVAEGSLLIGLEPVFQWFAAKGFSDFDEEGLLVCGFPVQFLPASTPIEREAVEQAILIEWEGIRMRVMRPEHLAAIALSVGRPKDRARVVYLCALPDFDRSRFADILNLHQLSDRWQEWSTGLGLDPKLPPG